MATLDRGPAAAQFADEMFSVDELVPEVAGTAPWEHAKSIR